MKRYLLVALLAGGLFGAPLVRAEGRSTPGLEWGYSTTASFANLFYFPAKLTVASVGLLGGALAGFATGGDTRAAYALWVPAAGGDFLVRPAHLDGSEPFSFWGSEYRDRPSTAGTETDGSLIYDAIYDE